MHSRKRDSERNSFAGRRAAFLFASVLAAIVFVCGCPGPKPPPEPINTVPTPKQPSSGAGQAAAGQGNVPPAPENVAPAQLQIESVAIQLNPQEHMPQLAMTVRNTGSSMAETSGSCGWKCPVTIKQITGFLQVENGDYVKPGQEKLLSPGGGVVNVCDGNKLPLTLSCSLSVQTVDSNLKKVGAPQTLQYSQTVTPP